ncbi:MAG: GNAT family protein [Symbiobacterium sp.]|uniref:GNAT family N-acetyltransferase n=1 Tax=Symbiobacterium sp. TaxID=1971213 RepID=UPI0034649B19
MQIQDIFGDLPSVETERLVLRKVSLDDVADQFAWTSDPLVTQFLTWGPERSPAETERSIRYILSLYAQGQVSPWAVVLKETGRQIGSCGFNWWSPVHRRAEISYMLNRHYWGRGFATEAVAAVIRFGFERMDLNRIEALVSPANLASRRVLEKVGMRPEGILREAINVKGVFADHIMYSLLRREWAQAQVARREEV